MTTAAAAFAAARTASAIAELRARKAAFISVLTGRPAKTMLSVPVPATGPVEVESVRVHGLDDPWFRAAMDGLTAFLACPACTAGGDDELRARHIRYGHEDGA